MLVTRRTRPSLFVKRYLIGRPLPREDGVALIRSAIDLGVTFS
jgi:hypothetical protein